MQSAKCKVPFKRELNRKKTCWNFCKKNIKIKLHKKQKNFELYDIQ